MTFVKNIGNFAVGNTAYNVFRVIQDGFKYCSYSTQSNGRVSRFNFGDEKTFNLSNEEIIVAAVLWVVDVRREMAALGF